MTRYIKTFLMISFWCYSQISLAQTPIDELLLIAGENNPKLKAQYDLYQAALQRIDQHGALPDPTLSFGYFISPVETRVGPQRFKLSISQMFPWLGTNKQKGSLARAQAKVEFERFMDLRNELFLNVKSTYADLYLLHQEMDFKKEEVAILQSFEPTVRTKYESNLVSLTDLIRVQISVENANSELSILEKKESALLSQLNTLLNRPLTTPLSNLSILEEQAPEASMLDSALSNNPKVLTAKARIDASDEMIKLSEIRNRPSFGIGLDYAFVGKRDDINVPDNGKDILMPMFSLSLPLFGKKNKSIKEEAKLLRSSATYSLEAEIDQLTNAWKQSEFEAEKATLLNEQIAQEISQTELMLNVLIGEYTNRNSNFEELLATQKRLIQLKIELEKVLIQQFKASINKEYLSGSTLKNLVQYENE